MMRGLAVMLLVGCEPEVVIGDHFPDLAAPPAEDLAAPVDLDMTMRMAPDCAHAPEDLGGAAGFCYRDEQCGPGLHCGAQAPGGICVGCTTAMDCPVAGSQCVDGDCFRPCATSSDCLGTECCESGACRPMTCVSDAQCPGPYHCLPGRRLCVRQPCTSTCPAGATCRSYSDAGSVCVEDYLSY